MLTGEATAAGVSLRYPGGALTLPAMHFVAEGPQPEPRGKPALQLRTAGRKPEVAAEPRSGRWCWRRCPLLWDCRSRWWRMRDLRGRGSS